ncbi:hypothetical protein niasHT_025717 [Heterodera trifolii]|uniref:CCHC-type domain-containing protein n=1 Tax=Heterodera trifolii TaxID=157864 RepID=A0ABD2K8S9_9BILA
MPTAKVVISQDGRKLVPFFTSAYPFSNHFSCRFVIDGLEFSSSEQMYMWAKASVFGDDESASAIMRTSNPKECKRIGSRIRLFDTTAWRRISIFVMTCANWHKFKQNEYLMRHLFNFGPDAEFVECAANDVYWGAGVALSDVEKIRHINRWPGKNILGRILSALMKKFLQMSAPTAPPNVRDLSEFPPLEKLTLEDVRKKNKIASASPSGNSNISKESCSNEISVDLAASASQITLGGEKGNSGQEKGEKNQNLNKNVASTSQRNSEKFANQGFDKNPDEMAEEMMEEFSSFNVKENDGKIVEYLVCQVEENIVIGGKLRTMANKSWPYFVAISNEVAEKAREFKKKLQMGDIVGVKKFEWKNDYRYLAKRETDKSHFNKMWYVQKINSQATVIDLSHIRYAILREHPGLVLRIREMVSNGVTKKLCAIIISPGLQLSSRCYRRQLSELELESLQEGQLIKVWAAFVPEQTLVENSFILPPQSQFRLGTEKQIEEGKGVLSIVGNHAPWPYQSNSRNVFFPLLPEMTLPEIELSEQIMSSAIAYSFEDEEKRIVEGKFEGRAEWQNDTFWLRFAEIDTEKMKKLKEVWTEEANVIFRTALDLPNFASGYVKQIDIERIREDGKPKFNFWIMAKVTNVQERKFRDVHAELEAAVEGGVFVVHPIIPIGVKHRRDCFASNLPSKIANLETKQGKMMRAVLGRTEEIIEENVDQNASAIQINHALMKKLNEKQQQTAKLLLSKESHFVFQHAPPGVGKTYVAAIVAAILLSLEKEVKIAIVTAANLPLAKLVQELNDVFGCDEMEESGSVAFFSGYAKEKYKEMLEKLKRHLLISKISNEEIISKFETQDDVKEIETYCKNFEVRPRLTKERKVANLYSEVADLRVVFTTVSMAESLINTALDGTTVLIFDEATQGSWVCLAHLVARMAKLEKVLVTGDQLQLGVHLQKLPPLLQSGFGLESMVDQLVMSPTVVQTRLTTCYRMHPTLVKAVASAVYEPNGEKFEPGRAAEDRSLLTASKFPLPIQSCPIVLLNVVGKCRQDPLSHSLTNDSQTAAAIQIVTALKNSILSPNVSLVVICLYSYQKESLQTEFERERIEVLVVTVDGYQAQESDLVILVTTRTSLRDGALTSEDSQIVGEEYLQILRNGRYMRDRYGQLIDNIGRVVQDLQFLQKNDENWRTMQQQSTSSSTSIFESRKRRADEPDQGPSARRNETWRPQQRFEQYSGAVFVRSREPAGPRGACFVCKRVGHLAKNCWYADGQSAGRGQPRGKGQWK